MYRNVNMLELYPQWNLGSVWQCLTFRRIRCLVEDSASNSVSTVEIEIMREVRICI